MDDNDLPISLPPPVACQDYRTSNMPGLCGAGIKLRPSSMLVKLSSNKATPPPQFHICKGPITMTVVGVHFHTQMPYHRGKFVSREEFIAYPPWSYWHQHEWHHHHHQGLQNLHQVWLRRRRWHRKMKSQMSNNRLRTQVCSEHWNPFWGGKKIHLFISIY